MKLSDDIVVAIEAHELKMRKFREKLVKSYPYPTLKHLHVKNARLLPTRYDMLNKLPENGTVCEIGVADGTFSQEIMKRCKPEKLHLVDAWDTDRYSSGEQQILKLFAVDIKNGSIQIDKGYSTDILPGFPDGYFDWVYIDSAHDYQITSKELAICMTKVRKGGIIAGHDYTPGNVVGPVPYGVIQAVQEFCMKNYWEYVYLTCESHTYVSFALKAIE